MPSIQHKFHANIHSWISLAFRSKSKLLRLLENWLCRPWIIDRLNELENIFLMISQIITNFRKIIIKYLSIRPQPARFACIPSLFCRKIRYKISASFNFSGWENLNINRIKSGKFCAETKTVFREYWCGGKTFSRRIFHFPKNHCRKIFADKSVYNIFRRKLLARISLEFSSRRKKIFHRKSADAWWNWNVGWCENSSNLCAKAKEEKRGGNFIEANKTDLSLRQRRFATSLSPRQSFA